MAQRTLTVRKIKEILRLKWQQGLSLRQIAASVRSSHSTVGEYLKRAEEAGLDWGQVEKLSEAELREKLFPPQEKPSDRPLPDWDYVENELKKRGVTRMLLWQEYISAHPAGYGYSQFCERYRRWRKAQQRPVLRRPKKLGEEAQVDYAGQTMPVINPQSGEVSEAQIFVGVLHASGLIYAEAHASQSSANWIRAHVRMFNFFGGVPRIIRPDNLKAGVTRPNFYEPDLNPTYHELAVHYNTAVIPTRVAKPTDKGLGENAVLQVERWLLAPLRNQRFFSLHDLNQALQTQLKWLNQRPRTGNAPSRRARFEAEERATLQPLPTYPFDYLEVKQAKVHIDYHVSFEKHHYSVPHNYTRQSVLIRASERLVEIYLENKRIACHPRASGRGYTTEKAHLPENHRWVLEWSPERFLRWARQIGEHTEILIAAVLDSRRHPEQGYRACLGILQLEKKVGKVLLDAACQHALLHKATSYKAVKRILETKKDMLVAQTTLAQSDAHEHIRGEQYYT